MHVYITASVSNVSNVSTTLFCTTYILLRNTGRMNGYVESIHACTSHRSVGSGSSGISTDEGA